FFCFLWRCLRFELKLLDRLILQNCPGDIFLPELDRILEIVKVVDVVKSIKVVKIVKVAKSAKVVKIADLLIDLRSLNCEINGKFLRKGSEASKAFIKQL